MDILNNKTGNQTINIQFDVFFTICSTYHSHISLGAKLILSVFSAFFGCSGQTFFERGDIIVPIKLTN